MSGWPAVLALSAVLLGTALATMALRRESTAARRDRAAPPPGDLIDVGGRRLHLVCRGEGPTVVLEAGGATPAMLFRGLQDRVAAFARVCVYDRAGFGWSDPAEPGRSFDDRADDLHRLLTAAGLPGPYVLVGESFGAFVVRAYARRHPEAVRAVLLIDGAEEEVIYADFPAFRRAGARSLTLGPWLSRFGVVRRAAMKRPAGLGLPAALPVEDRRTLVTYMNRPGYWDQVRDEIAPYDRVPADQRIAGGFGRLGDVPLVVIAHGRPMRGAHGVLESRWRAGQERLASLSTRGRLVIAEDSAHDIALTDPDLVARELRRLVRLAHRGQERTARKPPSMGSMAPVTQRDSSLAR